MELTELKRVVEALIFAADAPLTPERIRETLEDLNGYDLNQVVEGLNRDYDDSGRAFFIRQVAGGYQVTTRPELHTWVKKLFLGRNKMRLSQAALEALAIIAFKQPISRVDVAQIRGVNSDGVIGTLLEKKLVTISGRSEGVGRPLLYNTTPEFLQYFGVNDLTDLPKPREIEELIGREGMPEEVLQALSDEKQLELPMELNAEGRTVTDEAASAFLSPANSGGKQQSGAVETAGAEPAPEKDAVGENAIIAKEEPAMTSAAELAAEESLEADVDAIPVEEPDDTASPDAGAEGDTTPDEAGEGKKSAAPAPGNDFFLEDARTAATTATPAVRASTAIENEITALAMREEAALAPPPAPQHTPPLVRQEYQSESADEVRDDFEVTRFPQKVHVVDLDALAPQPVEAAGPSEAKPEFIEALGAAGSPLVVDIAATAHAPRRQTAELEPQRIIATAQHAAVPEEAPALSTLLADHGVQAEPVSPAARLADEMPPFFVLAPSENGAQPQSEGPKTGGGVLTFIKKAVGWIRNAWMKLVGK